MHPSFDGTVLTYYQIELEGGWWWWWGRPRGCDVSELG